MQGSALECTSDPAILTHTPTRTLTRIRMATITPTIIRTPTVILMDSTADTGAAIAVDTVAGTVDIADTVDIAVETTGVAQASAAADTVSVAAHVVAALTVVDIGKRSAKVVD